MIKIEFISQKEYDMGVKYDITDVSRSAQFVISPDRKTFRVFSQASASNRFLKKPENSGWRKLGCAKFACWERPDVFFHKVHSANHPNGNKATHVNVLFSEEGYNLVQEIAGKGNMAAWIRNVIAEKLNVKPTDLFRYGKDYKGTDVPQRE